MAEPPSMANFLKVRNKKAISTWAGLVMGSGSLPTSDVAKSGWWVSQSEYYLTLGFSQEMESTGNRKVEIYFEELIYVIVGAGKFKICRVSWQPGDSCKSWCQSLRPKAGTQAEFLCCVLEAELLLWERNLKGSLLTLKPTHIMEGNLLYLKSTDYNC